MTTKMKQVASIDISFREKRRLEMEKEEEEKKKAQQKMLEEQQQQSDKMRYLPYLLPAGHAPNGHAHPRTPMQQKSAASQKPVTVRSVKRRDKAKMEEKNSRMSTGHHVSGPAHVQDDGGVSSGHANESLMNRLTRSDDEEKAVMV